jgi:hypothetical protein
VQDILYQLELKVKNLEKILNMILKNMIWNIKVIHIDNIMIQIVQWMNKIFIIILNKHVILIHIIHNIIKIKLLKNLKDNKYIEQHTNIQ